MLNFTSFAIYFHLFLHASCFFLYIRSRILFYAYEKERSFYRLGLCHDTIFNSNDNFIPHPVPVCRINLCWYFYHLLFHCLAPRHREE